MHSHPQCQKTNGGDTNDPEPQSTFFLDVSNRAQTIPLPVVPVLFMMGFLPSKMNKKYYRQRLGCKTVIEYLPNM